MRNFQLPPATVSDAPMLINADELQPILPLLPIPKPYPTRKAEMILAIAGHLSGSRLQALWGRLDETQQLAVRETLHGPERVFDADRFRARYGKLPSGGRFTRWDTACRTADRTVRGAPFQSFVSKRRRKAAFAWCNPASVKITDLALLTGSEINPFSCRRFIVSQSNDFQVLAPVIGLRVMALAREVYMCERPPRAGGRPTHVPAGRTGCNRP